MNVLLDLDGTLTDPREGIVACIKHALRGLDYAIPLDSELVRYIGPPLQEIFASLLGPDGQSQIDTAVTLFRERFSAKGIFENSVYPGVRTALTQLQSLGASLYLASSKPQVFAERILHHFDLRGFFRAVYGSELDGTRSDKRDLIAYVLERESISPSSAYMVGDRAYDIVGARVNAVFPI